MRHSSFYTSPLSVPEIRVLWWAKLFVVKTRHVRNRIDALVMGSAGLPHMGQFSSVLVLPIPAEWSKGPGPSGEREVPTLDTCEVNDC